MKESDEERQPLVPSRRPPPWMSPIFVIPAMASFLFGYDIGGISAVVRILELSPTETGAVASFSLLGAMISSALALRFGDDLGRRGELVLSGCLYTIGTVIQTVSAVVGGVPSLLLGRVFYGLGIGVAMHASPLYIGEMADPDVRGQLVALKEAVIVSGILAGYVVGAVASGFDGLSAPIVFGAASLVSLPLTMSALKIAPESPRWLVLRSRRVSLSERDGREGRYMKRAKDEALRLCDGDTAAAAKFIAEVEASLGSSVSEETSVTQYLRDAKVRKALVVGLGLVFLQQITGQPSVLYFANKIFGDFGFGFEAAVGLGIFKLLMTVSSASVVENQGRRRLLLVGTAGMTFSLIGLALVFSGADGALTLNVQQSLIVGLILIFVGAYQIGFGPVTWLMLSEIFPLQVRSSSIGVATMVNFGTNWLVAAAFEPVRSAIGTAELYGCFGLLSMLSFGFVLAQVPETRGLTLEEIQEEL